MGTELRLSGETRSSEASFLTALPLEQAVGEGAGEPLLGRLPVVGGCELEENFKECVAFSGLG